MNESDEPIAPTPAALSAEQYAAIEKLTSLAERSWYPELACLLPLLATPAVAPAAQRDEPAAVVALRARLQSYVEDSREFNRQWVPISNQTMDEIVDALATSPRGNEGKGLGYETESASARPEAAGEQ